MYTLMYSFSYLEPVCCSMFSSNCCFLTCIQVSQETGQVVWYSHLLKNFPQFIVIHTVKAFSIVNKAEIDAFWNSLAFLMIQQILAIWSLVALPFLEPAKHMEFHSSHIIKAWLGEFEHYFTSIWDKLNYKIVWAFFGIAFLWDRNENWRFPVLWPLLSFPNLLAYWVQHFHSITF